MVLAGSSHPDLARAIAIRLGAPLVRRTVDRFPDGELRVRIEDDLRGRDVFLVQSICAPVGDHLLELLLLSDACRRSGAARVTGVLPYLGYARQERRDEPGIPLGARVVADALSRALDRAVVVDLHSAAVEGFFSIPVEQVNAVAQMADAVRADATNAVVVSPDLGAVKRAERFARLLGLPVAIVHKARVSGSEVSVSGVVGDVAGKAVIVFDDIISTAGTVEAAVGAVLQAGALREVTICATHGLFVGPAARRMQTLPLKRVVVTDSLPRAANAPEATEIVSLAGLLADTVQRLGGGD